MWVFAMTEEHQALDYAQHHFGTYVDREAGKQFALNCLSTVIHHIRLGAISGQDFCLDMANAMHNDGDRLNESTEGDWAGEASECDGDHARKRRITYWLKQMNEADAEDTRKLFEEQFGAPILTPIQEELEKQRKTPELQPA